MRQIPGGGDDFQGPPPPRNAGNPQSILNIRLSKRAVRPPRCAGQIRVPAQSARRNRQQHPFISAIRICCLLAYYPLKWIVQVFLLLRHWTSDNLLRTLLACEANTTLIIGDNLSAAVFF
ncbi:hypothetical protein ABF86_12420 [Nitrosomonas sp. GH22]|nr:hypothetical protein [Nitrosomonas sp. GH22]